MICAGLGNKGSSTNRGWEPGECRTVAKEEREISPCGYEIGRKEKPLKNTTRSSTGKGQMDPEFSGEEENTEIVFHPSVPAADPSPPAPPDSPDSSAEIQYGVVLDMV